MPGNRDKLVQAFLNLVKNAAEAIGENARAGPHRACTTAFRPGVRLSVPGSDARVSLPLMIEIEDNGPGVPEHLKPHLFDPFVTTKRNGTGLGLALVAKIIGDHGGIIECDSEPKRTVFRVLLPLQDQHVRPRSPARARGNVYGPRHHSDCRRRHRHPHRAQPGAGPCRLRAARHRQRRHAVALGERRARAMSSSPTSSCPTRTPST